MTGSVFMIFWPVMKTVIVKMVVMSRVAVSTMNKVTSFYSKNNNINCQVLSKNISTLKK